MTKEIILGLAKIVQMLLKEIQINDRETVTRLAELELITEELIRSYENS
jgi:hypothetical protein